MRRAVRHLLVQKHVHTQCNALFFGWMLELVLFDMLFFRDPCVTAWDLLTLATWQHARELHPIVLPLQAILLSVWFGDRQCVPVPIFNIMLHEHPNHQKLNVKIMWDIPLYARLCHTPSFLNMALRVRTHESSLHAVPSPRFCNCVCQPR